MGLYLLRGCLESVNATSECTNGGAARLPVYEIASPLFEKITIHLNEDYYAGGAIVIDAVGNGPGFHRVKVSGIRSQIQFHQYQWISYARSGCTR